MNARVSSVMWYLVLLFAILHCRLAVRSPFSESLMHQNKDGNMDGNLTCHVKVRLGFALGAEAPLYQKFSAQSYE